MKGHQYVRQARPLGRGLPVPSGRMTRAQPETALATQCQSIAALQERPTHQGVLREHPLRHAFKFRRNLCGALGFLATVTVSSTGFTESPSATTDGQIGATSTGSTTITVIIPSRVRVMGFNDITLGTFSGGALTGSSPACVSRNGPGSYSVTMTSANGSFALKSTTQAATIPYTVAWADNTIAYDKPVGPFPGDNASLAACAPVSDRLTVTVPPAHMDVAQPGAYADTLRIMVTPL